MKYFEVKEPYYALIAAKDEEKAKEVYEDMVSDIDNKEEFYNSMSEIKEEVARDLFMTIKDEDGTYPTLEEFEELKNDLVLIDSNLI